MQALKRVVKNEQNRDDQNWVLPRIQLGEFSGKHVRDIEEIQIKKSKAKEAIVKKKRRWNGETGQNATDNVNEFKLYDLWDQSTIKPAAKQRVKDHKCVRVTN